MPKLHILFALFLLISSFSNATEAFPAFDRNDEQSTTLIDHSPWQTFLTSHLMYDDFGQSFFAYQQVTATELTQLDNYLNSLTRILPWTLTAQEEKAYWINLYNALTVKVVLDAYPVSSIKDIDGKFGGLVATGPWDKQRIEIAGMPISLNNIEHDIVRPKYDDYRIHFAFNCAAKGCPNLSGTAFTADNIEQQLNDAELTFVNHIRGIRFEGSTLILSKIFDWYLEDFAANESELIALLAPKTEPTLRARLNGYKGRIKYEYDWSLNEAK